MADMGGRESWTESAARSDGYPSDVNGGSGLCVRGMEGPSRSPKSRSRSASASELPLVSAPELTTSLVVPFS